MVKDILEVILVFLKVLRELLALLRDKKLRCPQMGQIDNAILLMTVNRSGFTTGVFSD